MTVFLLDSCFKEEWFPGLDKIPTFVKKGNCPLPLFQTLNYDQEQNSQRDFNPSVKFFRLFEQRDSLGNDGATNHHYQHRHGHQLQTVVTWVLDELERNQKKGKSSKNNSQDDGHLSSGPAEHV